MQSSSIQMCQQEKKRRAKHSTGTYLQSFPACFSHLLLALYYTISAEPLSTEVKFVETTFLTKL